MTRRNLKMAIFLIVLWQFLTVGASAQQTYFPTDVAWKNIKTDYGARGDGVTDDTAAFQTAFSTLLNPYNSRVAVFVPNSQHAEQLDRLLWEQFPTGFTPHCRQQNSLSAETPIVFCTDMDVQWPCKTVLNLSDEIPAHLDQIEQLVEIVSQDSETRAAGRTRFRSYQEAGFVVETRNAGKELAK